MTWWRQQAITWTSVDQDLWRHMALIGHNELTLSLLMMPSIMKGSGAVGPTFKQTRTAWSMDQGSTMKSSVVYKFAPTVMQFSLMWEA